MIYISCLCCCRQFASPSQSSRQNCFAARSSHIQANDNPPRVCVYRLEECDGAIRYRKRLPSFFVFTTTSLPSKTELTNTLRLKRGLNSHHEVKQRVKFIPLGFWATTIAKRVTTDFRRRVSRLDASCRRSRYSRWRRGRCRVRAARSCA